MKASPLRWVNVCTGRERRWERQKSVCQVPSVDECDVLQSRPPLRRVRFFPKLGGRDSTEDQVASCVGVEICTAIVCAAVVRGVRDKSEAVMTSSSFVFHVRGLTAPFEHRG